MLKRESLHEYQNSAIGFIALRPKCALFLDMGLGKTVISLTAIADYMADNPNAKVLIVAPLRVANTVWKQESEKWEHLSHLNVVIATGSVSARTKAISSDANVVVINRENVPWIEPHGNWDLVIVDESSSFKSFKALRFKALRKITARAGKVVLLTGTPSPNGIMDLWSQIALLDNGYRLGRNITSYRNRYFDKSGYHGYTYTPKSGAYDAVREQIADICMSMSAKDYLSVPERLDVTRFVELDVSSEEIYRNMKRNFIVELGDSEITALSAGVLVNKLLQISNGALYDQVDGVHFIHDAKVDCLQSLVDDNPTENLLVAYSYKSDLVRLQAKFPDAVTLSSSGKEVEQWNSGKIKMLLAHPASAGHGLNLQAGGSVVVWFGLNWSLELYEQFNARLHRQGQSNKVKVIHILAKNTVDERVLSVLRDKSKTQADLIKYLKYEE
jgi:SNF2 family DNA or RNA helicase